MGRPALFSGPALEEILRRRSAGENSRQIAAVFGTSHQNIENAIARAMRDGEAGGAGGKPDEFESAQRAALRRIKRDLRAELSAQGRALLTKALNDTIKALRVHSLMKPPENTGNDAATERVVARLQRLASRSVPVATVSESVADPSEKDGTGG